jgi:hypothetical protein
VIDILNRELAVIMQQAGTARFADITGAYVLRSTQLEWRRRANWRAAARDRACAVPGCLSCGSRIMMLGTRGERRGVRPAAEHR